jgi:hypothetical protein
MSFVSSENTIRPSRESVSIGTPPSVGDAAGLGDVAGVDDSVEVAAVVHAGTIESAATTITVRIPLVHLAANGGSRDRMGPKGPEALGALEARLGHGRPGVEERQEAD